MQITLCDRSGHSIGLDLSDEDINGIIVVAQKHLVSPSSFHSVTIGSNIIHVDNAIEVMSEYILSNQFPDWKGIPFKNKSEKLKDFFNKFVRVRKFIS